MTVVDGCLTVRIVWSGYTDDVTAVNPDTANVFAAAAYRFGHSLIPDTMKFTDPTLRYSEDVSLSEVRVTSARWE